LRLNFNDSTPFDSLVYKLPNYYHGRRLFIASFHCYCFLAGTIMALLINFSESNVTHTNRKLEIKAVSVGIIFLPFPCTLIHVFIWSLL
jgi:hypothetical protein